ncbi:MAG TPA: HAD family phosphatase [Acidimicrobiales bacterium]|nr:HAD family phosphatase [Acidimicrobiales bacterium]
MRANGALLDAVVFDLGGVLMEWEPRRLYRTMFDDDAAMEHFLATVCTPAWNDELDRGLPFAAGVAQLTALHPEHAELISAYHSRWDEMLGGAIDDAVDVLRDLKAASVPVYALSNWSAETYPVARRRYEFLDWFDGVLISGDVGVTKPDPRIFDELCDRFGLQPARTLFVDDRRDNVEGARRYGLLAVQFTSGVTLRESLRDLGLRV